MAGIFGTKGAVLPDASGGADGPGLSMQDRAAIFLSMMNGDIGTAMQLRALPAQRARQKSFLDEITPLLSPQYSTGAAPSVGAPPQVGAGSGPADASPAVSAAVRALAPGPTPQATQPYQYQPPVRTADGLSINDPRMAGLTLRGQAAGVDLSKVIDVLKAQQPDVGYDRGFGYDKKTGGALGAFHPDLDKGQEPLYDANGKFAGVRNASGSVQSAAEMAGAVSGAQEAAKAGLDLVDVPQSDGSMRKVPRLQAVQMLLAGHPDLTAAGAGAAGGGGGVSGAGGGPAPTFGVTQTPAQATLGNKRAEDQAAKEAAQAKTGASLIDLDRTSDFVSRSIHDILGETQDPKTGRWVKTGSGDIGMFTTGLGANLAPIKGIPAHDLQAKLDNIKANTAVEELQKMRDNSPTGAALGRVTQSEINMLSTIRGSLDQGQSGDQLAASLRGQLQQLEKIRGQRHALYASEYPGGQASGQPSAQPRTPTMAGKGYRIISVR